MRDLGIKLFMSVLWCLGILFFKVVHDVFLQALDGFIMIITTDGQLFYVSESVKDFLGYSQVITSYK